MMQSFHDATPWSSIGAGCGAAVLVCADVPDKVVAQVRNAAHTTARDAMAGLVIDNRDLAWEACDRGRRRVLCEQRPRASARSN
jgi:hypothetical protein